MKKLKKLMTLVAACGMTVSAWAMTPEADAVAPLPVAEGGWAAVHYGFKWMGWSTYGLAYDLAMAVGQGAGATAGGLIGSSFGPVGTVVGGAVGAA